MTESKKIIFNRRLKNKKIRNMTLIIGANCKDGVVLVADRKVTNSDRLVDKIIKPKDLNVIFTAGGFEGVFEDYLEDLTRNVDYHIRWYEEQNKENPTLQREYDFQQFKKTSIDTLTELKNTYRALGKNRSFDEILQVFFTIPENRGDKLITRLYKMDMEECYPQAVDEDTISVIGYERVASPFLKSLENGNKIIMKDVARVATFAIKYIERENLGDDAVGIGNRDPQIYFIYHGQPPKEILGDELKKLLEGVDEEVEKLRSFIGSTSSFLRS